MSLSYDIPKDEIRSGRFVLDGEVWVKERTCNISDHVADVAWCSECKEPMKYPDHPNYCPTCGAKVVSE